MSAQGSIIIPLKASDEVVEIERDNLPEDVNEVLDVLKAEIAPLPVWLQLGLEYHAQKKYQQFEILMKEATQQDTLEKYSESIYETIQLLNAFAGYYIERAENATDDKERKELYAKASTLLKTAELIDPNHSMILAGKGIVALNQGDVPKAELLFDTALVSNNNNITAILGKACVLYHKANYKGALDQYKQVLQLNPDAPASIRVGVGLCHYKLNNLELARKSFKRALQLNEFNSNAEVALGIMNLNENNAKNAITVHFRNAIMFDSKHPVALNKLADHFFITDNLPKVHELASNAFANTRMNDIKSEAVYHRARVYHREQQMDNAFKYYQQAVQLNPENLLARFGLGQIFIARSENDKAIQQFEHIAKVNQDSYEVFKILGSLHGKKDEFDLAVKYLRKANELNPKDAEILIEMAQYETDSASALNNMQKAAQMIPASAETFQLLNNLGVLYLKMGNPMEAETQLQKAFSVAGITMDSFSDDFILLVYNMAICKEYLQKFSDAKSILLSIIKSHPSWTHAYLRMALVEFKSNNLQQAIDWCTLISKMKPQDATPHALVGYFYLKKEEWSKAQAKFEHIVQNVDKNNIFTHMALGCVYALSLRPHEMKEDKIESYIKYARQFFERALKNDNKNVYAALSLAALIADYGYLEEARDLFTRAKDYCKETPEILINIGHVFLAQQNYVNAAKMYETVSKKVYHNKNGRIFILLAKALYEDKKWDESAEALQKAIDIDANNFIAHFNAGIVFHEHAMALLNEKKKGTTDIASRAIEKAENAIQKLQHVIDVAQKDNTLREKARQHLQNVQTTLKKANAALLKANQDLQQAEQLRDQQRKEMEAVQEKQKLDAEEKKAKFIKSEEEKKLRAEENAKKMEELQRTWIKTAPIKSSSKNEKGGSARSRREDEFIDDQQPNDNDEQQQQATDATTPDTPKKQRKPRANKKKKDATETPTKTATPKKKKLRALKENKEDETPASSTITSSKLEDGDSGDDDNEEQGNVPSADGEAEFDFDNDNSTTTSNSNKRALEDADEDEPKSKKQKLE